jgi:hypothetical protein
LGDPFGESVIATFERKSGTLHIFDQDTGEYRKVTNVFSGNGACANDPAKEGEPFEGPLPSGEYLIGEGYNSGHVLGDDWWYKLYGPDGSGGYSYQIIPVTDSKGATQKRGYFNLHTGRESDGCVTVTSDLGPADKGYPNSKDYDKIKHILDGTSRLKYKGSNYTGYLYVK